MASHVEMHGPEGGGPPGGGHSTHRNGSDAGSQFAGMIVHVPGPGPGPCEPQPTIGGSKCAQKAPGTPHSLAVLQRAARDPQSPPMLEGTPYCWRKQSFQYVKWSQPQTG